MKEKGNVLPTLVFLAAVVWAVGISQVALRRHYLFSSNLWDLGWMEQVVWNTANGRIFNHSIRGDPGGNFLEEHLTLVPLLVAPLYRLLPQVETLIVIQSVSLALGALLLYLVAGEALQNQWAAFLITVAYLGSPLLIKIALYDFHEIALIVSILMAMFLMMIKGHDHVVIILALLALTIREEVALTIASLGLLAWLWGRHRLGKALVLLALGSAVLMVVFSSISFQAGSFTRITGYRYPLVIAAHLKILALKLSYLVGILVVFSFLPLLGGPAFLTALPGLIYNSASTFLPQLSWCCQYQAILVAPLFVASVFGIDRAARSLRRHLRFFGEEGVKVMLSAWLLTITLFSGARSSAHDILVFLDPPLLVKERAKFRQRAVRLIPPHVAVAAGNSLGAHLAQREQLYDFPRYPFRGEWVIFDTWNLVDQGFEGLEFYQFQLDKLNSRPDYQLVADFAGILVYKKVAP